MKTYTKKSLIAELNHIRNKGWILNKRKGNHGGVGNTLEEELGIEENNLPLPNAAEWELKAQRLGSNSLVTMFHMEPSPRAMKFVPSVLLPQYGWSHQEAGKKYSNAEMSFRQTIPGSSGTDRGFKTVVDFIERKVLISFDHTKVDPRHNDWLANVEANTGLEELDPQPYWGFDDLIHKAGTKLHNCFFVEANVRKQTVAGILQESYHYQNIFMLKGLDVSRFVKSLDEGNIVVDFDARTGHNHGTKFRLKASHLKDLYAEVTQL